MYAEQALALSQQLHDKSLQASAWHKLGVVFQLVSDCRRALECYAEAIRYFEGLDDTAGLAAAIGNAGTMYRYLLDYPRAVQYTERARDLFVKIGSKSGVARNTGNLGLVNFYLGEYQNALRYYGEAFSIFEEMGNLSEAAVTVGNIGEVYLTLSDFERALDHFTRALESHEQLGNLSDYAYQLLGIGSVYASKKYSGYDFNKAYDLFTKALGRFEELGQKQEQYEAHKHLADLYAGEELWKEHSTHFRKFYEIEKVIQSEDAKKQADRLDFERKATEREKQIAIERSRFQERESILNNILPEEITLRLVNGENPIADQFDNVSILFMDLVDFTSLAAAVSAQHLVYLLNSIFKAADGVMREFGLEKIKTIGDAYMAVAGAPIQTDDHAERAARAAAKLLHVMKNLVIEFPDELGDKSWIDSIPVLEVRIGLNCGPVAAGVVGDNKFVYDLWGEAVNTAARMESSGMAGRIHCSDSFVRQIQSRAQTPGFVSVGTFIERGNLDVKGMGVMRTYFLE
jgi:class 3 adenylate cyclase